MLFSMLCVVCLWFLHETVLFIAELCFSNCTSHRVHPAAWALHFTTLHHATQYHTTLRCTNVRRAGPHHIALTSESTLQHNTPGLFAGFAVFGTAGFIAHKLDVDVKDLDLSGAGLAFEVYPTALSRLNGAHVFSVLFFLMMVLLAIDSQVPTARTCMCVGANSSVEFVCDS